MQCQNTKVNLCSQQARHDVFEKIKIFPNLRENQFPKSEGLHNHEQSLRPLTNIINITITFFFSYLRDKRFFIASFHSWSPSANGNEKSIRLISTA